MRGLSGSQRRAVVCSFMAFFIAFVPGMAQESPPAGQTGTAGQAAPATLEALKKSLADAGKAAGEKLNQNLRKASKEQGDAYDKVLTANKPVNLATPTDAEKEKLRGELAQAWRTALDAPIKASLDQADAERLKTLDTLGTNSDKMAPVNTAFRELRDKIKIKLEEARSEAAIKKLLAAWDPAAANEDAKVKAKAKAQDLFEGLTADIFSTFAAEWGRSEAKVLAGFEGPSTSQQIANLQEKLKTTAAQNETDYYEELRKQTGFSRVVRCVWTDSKPPLLTCKPDLRISAAEIGEIVISNLPPDKNVRVTALTADKIQPATFERATTIEKVMEGIVTQEKDDERKNRGVRPSPGSICPKATEASGEDWKDILSCDEQIFAPGQGGTVMIGVFKGRRFSPIYGGYVARSSNALTTLRGSEPWKTGLSLLISGSVSQILVKVEVIEDKTLATTTVPVGYERWGFETGGFFAVTRLTDEKLIQQTTDDQVEIKRVTDAENISQETGIFLNFIPRNYPALGFGVGFSTSSGRPLSTYIGPTVRLRSFGQRGIANFSTGLALRSVERFPGVNSGDKLPANSPLLTAQDEYHVAPYFLLQLGFSFGPISGPEDSGTGNR